MKEKVLVLTNRNEKILKENERLTQENKSLKDQNLESNKEKDKVLKKNQPRQIKRTEEVAWSDLVINLIHF